MGRLFLLCCLLAIGVTANLSPCLKALTSLGGQTGQKLVGTDHPCHRAVVQAVRKSPSDFESGPRSENKYKSISVLVFKLTSGSPSSLVATSGGPVGRDDHIGGVRQVGNLRVGSNAYNVYREDSFAGLCSEDRALQHIRGSIDTLDWAAMYTVGEPCHFTRDFFAKFKLQAPSAKLNVIYSYPIDDASTGVSKWSNALDDLIAAESARLKVEMAEQSQARETARRRTQAEKEIEGAFANYKGDFAAAVKSKARSGVYKELVSFALAYPDIAEKHLAIWEREEAKLLALRAAQEQQAELKRLKKQRAKELAAQSTAAVVKTPPRSSRTTINHAKTTKTTCTDCGQEDCAGTCIVTNRGTLLRATVSVCSVCCLVFLTCLGVTVFNSMHEE